MLFAPPFAQENTWMTYHPFLPNIAYMEQKPFVDFVPCLDSTKSLSLLLMKIRRFTIVTNQTTFYLLLSVFEDILRGCF